MTIPIRDLQRQYTTLKNEIDYAINYAVSSGAYIMGEQVAQLEHDLAAYVGATHCITCANGTDALTLALMAINIGHGDAVFVPDFTFFATAEAVARVGATPIFVDVQRTSFNIDADDLSNKYANLLANSSLTPKAVIAVDLFGQPADYTAIKNFCTTHNVLLIEDGAQGFGGAKGTARTCSFGDISTTSFFPAKPLGCYGDGGALFTNNDDYADILRSLRIHGKGVDKYDNIRIGLNSRLDTIQAAILRVKLHHFEDEMAATNKVATMYSNLLDSIVETPYIDSKTTSSWAQYTILTPHRDELHTKLHANNISTAIYYPKPLHCQSAFNDIRHMQLDCPTSTQLCSQVLSLPIGPYINEQEIVFVANKIRETLINK